MIFRFHICVVTTRPKRSGLQKVRNPIFPIIHLYMPISMILFFTFKRNKYGNISFLKFIMIYIRNRYLHEGITRVHAIGRQLLSFCMILFYHYIVSLSFL